MAFDDNELNVNLTSTIADSFNDYVDSSTNTDADFDVDYSEDNSVNDSGNTDIGIVDSGNVDSGNTDIDLDDSGNTDSYNDWFEYTDNSETDESVNAGNREYNLGMTGWGGAAGAAGGDTMINNQNTVLDQSVNQNIAAFGGVGQTFGNAAVVASGEDSMAAGGDISVTTDIDQSTDISAGGDVLIDSTQTVESYFNSGNSFDFSYSEETNTTDIDISDSWNSFEVDTNVTDSFNSESIVWDETNVDLDVDAIVDSTGAVIGDVDLGF